MVFRYLSFNRTFMELKYICVVPASNQAKVLIVPLWNWNISYIFALWLHQSFNRTFMELKYSIGEYHIHAQKF